MLHPRFISLFSIIIDSENAFNISLANRETASLLLNGAIITNSSPPNLETIESSEIKDLSILLTFTNTLSPS